MLRGKRIIRTFADVIINQEPMRKFLTLLFALCLSLAAEAQHIYQGGSVYNTKLYTWDGKHLYQGGSVYNTKVVTLMGATFIVAVASITRSC